MRNKTMQVTISLLYPPKACPFHPAASMLDVEHAARAEGCEICQAMMRAWYHAAEARLAMAEFHQRRHRVLLEGRGSRSRRRDGTTRYLCRGHRRGLAIPAAYRRGARTDCHS